MIDNLDIDICSLSLNPKENRRVCCNVSNKLRDSFYGTVKYFNHDSYHIGRKLVIYFMNDVNDKINRNRIVPAGYISAGFRIRISVWEEFQKKCKDLRITVSNTMRFLMEDYVEGCRNNDPFFIGLGNKE